MAALGKLADDKRAETIRQQLQGMAQSPDATLNQAAVRAIEELDNRFSSTQLAANERAQKVYQKLGMQPSDYVFYELDWSNDR